MSAALMFAYADCPNPGCKWRTEGRNAMGLAQQHANRTGHRPWVTLEYAMRPKDETPTQEHP